MTVPRRVALVGAGLAALSTCDALRAQGYDGELVLYSAERGLPYDRPPLSKDVLLGKARREDVLLRPEQWYEQQRVSLREGAPVQAIRPGEGGLELHDGSVVTADRIVLATGGTPRALPVPGGDDPAVHLLRTWEDAERLRERLLPGAVVAVVGAGLIGAETAAVAHALGCRVTLVDPVPVPLTAVVGDDIAGALHHRHSAEGIDVITAGVERVERRPGGSGVLLHFNVDGGPLAADLVVVGIGIRPAVELAEAAGLSVDNGVVVGEGRHTSHPNVFAVGDVARREGHPVRHEHWEAAQRDGETAAYGLLGRPAPEFGAPWFWSDRHGARLEAVGTMADAERAVVRGTPEEGAFTVFGLRDGRLVAAAAIDRGRDIKAARRLVDRRVEVDPGQLADESTDLRALLRR
ncbi:NAD(P)/FAD-dependent oxidoreductase [Streptomyces ipomoeae]|uniref:Pyridine nucleotide-disulfide oxidoreductase n=1 Tax=Streptomyces ipomoeae 91-03 TaxID=698759 RepID=L1KLP5_9ACTN|nr:FAD-dependent oxidoreductase [Streptomyces ipomoeae]EKX61736.1 pyridine nucleotide-disulfide oxidoreductase [Streptomyces ipomoeae 91-03]MDX2692515.1 FAD-dependent oxidoreductase [Streptomyces ipomoeae]MDX2838144.1 FAD-dependent oxidoreductase [Streptomyces ipomoeae]